MTILNPCRFTTVLSALLVATPACGDDGRPLCDVEPNNVLCGDGGAVEAGPCGFCPAALPACNTTNNTCVACVANADCTDNNAAVCDPATNTCVACASNNDCGPDKAVCNTTSNTCEACTRNTDCAAQTTENTCDTANGTCVECLQGSDCATGLCNPDNTCSLFGTEQDTCEPCDNDANCQSNPNHFCVPMFFDEVSRPGGYCLKDTTTACTEPYLSTLSERTTLSGVTGKSFCGIDEDAVSCEAVLGLELNQDCTRDGFCTPVGEPEIMAPGALCRPIGGNNKCTYPCGSTADCPVVGAASSCDNTTMPTSVKWCGG